MSSSDSKLRDSESIAAAIRSPEDQAKSSSPIDSKVAQEEQVSEDSGQSGKVSGNGKEGEEGENQEEEEEGECGFCLFMKGGGCRESFTDWENCIQEAEKNEEDIVEKCFQVTAALKKCMEAHADYYEPILKAEKAAEEEAIIELENEAITIASQDTNSRDVEGSVGSEDLEQREASDGSKSTIL